MSRGVEMGGHWFLELLVANVAAVSFEVDMERVLCFSKSRMYSHETLSPAGVTVLL